VTPRRLLPGLVLVASSVTCVPSLGPDDSQITSTRTLAVRAEPAEAKPGATKITFTALVASPGGTVKTPDVVWSFCSAPKPITEDNVVSNACLQRSALVPAGNGPSTVTKTPSKGCSLFGPDVGATGGFRPRDPDSTGGYYQPLRVDLAGADTAFEPTRIQCDLAGADADAATAFGKAYKPNVNPVLSPLTAKLGGSPVMLGTIPEASHVTLEASWPASSAETFAYFDPASQTVTSQREAMQVAWYTTGGTLDTESTGRASSDMATTSDDGWTAPGVSGVVHLWVVLRDSRGGVDFLEQDLVVGP